MKIKTNKYKYQQSSRFNTRKSAGKVNEIVVAAIKSDLYWVRLQ